MDFIFQNWFGLLILIGVIAYIAYLAITKQWAKVREFAYQMMLLAERTFSDSDGGLKFDFVAGIVYRFLPPWLKLFVKEEHVKRFVQKWYITAKDYLDDGIINDSIMRLK